MFCLPKTSSVTISASVFFNILKISFSTFRSNSVNNEPSFLTVLLEESIFFVNDLDISKALIAEFNKESKGLSNFKIMSYMRIFFYTSKCYQKLEI